MKHFEEQKQDKTEQPTGHWRLGPHGHLRSEGQPASIKKMKKKHAKKSITIAAASIIVAALLVVSVLFFAHPNQEPPRDSAETVLETDNPENPKNQDQDAQETEATEKDEQNSGNSSDNTDQAASGSDQPDRDPGNQNRAPKGNKVNVNQLPDSSFLYDTDIAELVAADTFNDGQIVQIKGEVVGDAINDEQKADVCWITIQDDDELNPSTISVQIDKEKLSLIDTFGRYGTVGSIVQVRGEYHLACADHEGLSDIHVEEMQLLEEGKIKEAPINPVVITAAVISVLLGGALLVLYSIRRERMR